MAKNNKLFHARPKVTLDLQSLKGIEAIQQLSQELKPILTAGELGE